MHGIDDRYLKNIYKYVTWSRLGHRDNEIFYLNDSFILEKLKSIPRQKLFDKLRKEGIQGRFF